MKFNAEDITLIRINERPLICFRFPEHKLFDCQNFVEYARDMAEKNEDCEVRFQAIKKKRSLNANNYLWTLCTKIAEVRSRDKVKVTKEDIYKDQIKDLGIYCDDEIDLNKVKWRRSAWEMLGTGWITERVDYTPDGSKEIIRFYYGSSQYNTKQMSRLIDNVVQDCHALGIETKTPNEIADMMSLWEEERAKV